MIVFAPNQYKACFMAYLWANPVFLTLKQMRIQYKPLGLRACYQENIMMCCIFQKYAITTASPCAVWTEKGS